MRSLLTSENFPLCSSFSRETSLAQVRWRNSFYRFSTFSTSSQGIESRAQSHPPALSPRPHLLQFPSRPCCAQPRVFNRHYSRKHGDSRCERNFNSLKSSSSSSAIFFDSSSARYIPTGERLILRGRLLSSAAREESLIPWILFVISYDTSLLSLRSMQAN